MSEEMLKKAREIADIASQLHKDSVGCGDPTCGQCTMSIRTALHCIRDEALEEAAEECLKTWRNSSNVRSENLSNHFLRNARQDGCIASSKAILALKTSPNESGE